MDFCSTLPNPFPHLHLPGLIHWPHNTPSELLKCKSGCITFDLQILSAHVGPVPYGGLCAHTVPPVAFEHLNVISMIGKLNFGV